MSIAERFSNNGINDLNRRLISSDQMDSLDEVHKVEMDEKETKVPEPTESNPIVAVIIDSMTENNTVKFSLSVKANAEGYSGQNFQINRIHDEFAWLHQMLNSDDKYMGFVIPPLPNRPDFSSVDMIGHYLAESGHKPTENDSYFNEEIKSNYINIFKKTVHEHQTFINRILSHPALRTNYFLRIFLTQDSSITTKAGPITHLKNWTEKIKKAFNYKVQDVNSGLLNIDEYFEKEKVFYKNYNDRIKICISAGKTSIGLALELSIMLHNYANLLKNMSTLEYTKLPRVTIPFVEYIESYKKLFSRTVYEDEKFIEMLNYIYRNSKSCIDLIYKQQRAAQLKYNSEQKLNRARERLKDIEISQVEYDKCSQLLDTVTEQSKKELDEQQTYRVSYVKTSLVKYCENQIKFSKANQKNLHILINAIEAEDFQ